MMQKITLLFLSLFFAIHVAIAQAPLVNDLGYRGGSIAGIKKIPNALHFVVFGDWGRNGENYQKEVAAGMGKAAHDLDAAFVIATGDNFYPYGVNSTQDYHWISSFESIYRAQSLHVKWYPVLGNHDYISNPQAQVDYSKISSRWTMPARYHSKKFFINGDTTQAVLIAFIDTDPLEKKMRGGKPDSAKYPAGGAEAQIAWLESILSDNTVKWKMVVGHHPVYTGGWRHNIQDTKNMQGLLEPLFKKYNVDVYIAGHEHHLEYYKPEGKTHYIISGAGSEARPAQITPTGGRFIAPQQGFATFSVARDNILIQFINHKDEIIKSQMIIK
jgi:UDP-2,3-diacylglucosamine pyrophosphatase LpxH